MSFTDVNDMPLAAIRTYIDRLPMVKADFKLEINEVVMRPHMEKRDQKDLHDQWQITFFGEKPSARKPRSMDFARMGIGYRKVK